MTKINILSLCFILGLLISCDRTEPRMALEKELDKFPKLIDVFNNQNLELPDYTWLNFGNHEPYYIGKLTDTIKLGRFIRPMELLLPPPGTDTTGWHIKPMKKGRFDHYFIDWMDPRQFKNRDSISLLIKIDSTRIINNDGRQAFPVLIQNKSADTVTIGYGDHIPLIAEAKTTEGVWKPIEKRFVYGCGVGLHFIILPPDEIVITSQLIYSGTFKTKLRIKMGRHYSEEFPGAINPSQFESPYDANGIRKPKPNKLN